MIPKMYPGVYLIDKPDNEYMYNNKIRQTPLQKILLVTKTQNYITPICFTHLKRNDTSRLQNIIKLFNKQSGIIMGDMNMFPNLINTFLANNHKLHTNYLGFTTKYSPIDHIITVNNNNNLSVYKKNINCLIGNKLCNISDHYLIGINISNYLSH